ncbi:MAG: sulfate transporter family protein [Nitratireductor sp.]|nr:sulfate transporter family protein [Nitratireductor sp.]
MVIASARLAASELLQPAFRRVLLKSVGLTILLFIGTWIGLDAAFSTFLAPVLGPWPWVTTAVLWLMSAGLLVGAGFLLAPVTALIAGLFLDDVADHVEQVHYRADGRGVATPALPAVLYSIRFTALVIVANLVALLLVLLPGINVVIFFLVNGYLLGREYFMFAAMRFVSEAEANALRRANSTHILLAGFVIAGFMAVPVLNLATPVFAAALMVHLNKAIARRCPDRETGQGT